MDGASLSSVSYSNGLGDVPSHSMNMDTLFYPVLIFPRMARPVVRLPYIEKDPRLVQLE